MIYNSLTTTSNEQCMLDNKQNIQPKALKRPIVSPDSAYFARALICLLLRLRRRMRFLAHLALILLKCYHSILCLSKLLNWIKQKQLFKDTYLIRLKQF